MPRHGQGVNPYPNGNFATNLDFLEELILIASKEKGQEPIPEESGYEDILIISQEVAKLSFPDNVVSALIMVELDASSNNLSRGIRFKENGTDPTANSGFGLGDNDVYTIVGKENIERFRVTGIEAEKRHILRVQYFKSQQNEN